MIKKGYVLAGGRGRRMGGNKALLRYRGRSLLEGAIEILHQSQVESVQVVTSSDQLFLELELEQLVDRLPGRGPLGGLETALHDVGEGHAYILACDLPLIPASLYARLESRLAQADAALPHDRRGQLHPLCAIYRGACLPAVRRLLGGANSSAHSLVRQLNCRIVSAADLELPDSVFVNVNTPQDLDEILKI